MMQATVAATAAVASSAGEALVMGPYVTAMAIDPEGLGYMNEHRLEGETGVSVYADVHLAADSLMAQLNSHISFAVHGLRAKSAQVQREELEPDHFLTMLGGALAAFGLEHPEEYRGAVRAVGQELRSARYRIGLGDSDDLRRVPQFLSLVNWKVERERERFRMETRWEFLPEHRQLLSRNGWVRSFGYELTGFGIGMFGGSFIVGGWVPTSLSLPSIVAILGGGILASFAHSRQNRADQELENRLLKAMEEVTLQPIVIDPDTDWVVGMEEEDFTSLSNQLFWRLREWLPFPVGDK